MRGALDPVTGQAFVCVNETAAVPRETRAQLQRFLGGGDADADVGTRQGRRGPAPPFRFSVVRQGYDCDARNATMADVANGGAFDPSTSGFCARSRAVVVVSNGTAANVYDFNALHAAMLAAQAGDRQATTDMGQSMTAQFLPPAGTCKGVGPSPGAWTNMTAKWKDKNWYVPRGVCSFNDTRYCVDWLNEEAGLRCTDGAGVGENLFNTRQLQRRVPLTAVDFGAADGPHRLAQVGLGGGGSTLVIHDVDAAGAHAQVVAGGTAQALWLVLALGGVGGDAGGDGDGGGGGAVRVVGLDCTAAA